MTPPATLLIDDQASFTASIEASFQAHGLAVDVANNWDSGLRMFRAGLHELVVVDYNLPGSKRGLKLLLEIKRLRPSAHLVLISGAVTPTAEDLIAASRLVDRFLPKSRELARELRKEAQDAERRATSPSDWQAVATAQLSKDELDDEALDRVDAALSIQVAEP